MVLTAVIMPPLPSSGQIFNTFLVTLFSGVFATSLFLLARNRSKNPNQLAAVDAPQSSEVIFAIIGKIIFLNAPLPNRFAITGICIVFIGLALFIRFQEIEKNKGLIVKSYSVDILLRYL